MVTLQELYTGDDKLCTVGFSEENKALNRFKNITVCMYELHKLILTIKQHYR